MMESTIDFTTVSSIETTPASQDEPPEDVTIKFMDDIIATSWSTTMSLA
jgi:hypothetical protein